MAPNSSPTQIWMVVARNVLHVNIHEQSSLQGMSLSGWRSASIAESYPKGVSTSRRFVLVRGRARNNKFARNHGSAEHTSYTIKSALLRCRLSWRFASAKITTTMDRDCGLACYGVSNKSNTSVDQGLTCVPKG